MQFFPRIRFLLAGLLAAGGLVGMSAQLARAAVMQDGTLYAWGWNAYGQVSNGTTTDHYTTPVAVSGLGSGVTAMAGGWRHSLALQNGAVYAWGYNGTGELGDGTTTDHYTPIAVSGLGSGVTAIAAGNQHNLAVQNGALYAWGYNNFYQLGAGVPNNYLTTPVAVLGLGSGVTAIAGGEAHSLAVQNGVVYAWGNNSNGELGVGTAGSPHTTPAAVSNLGNGVTDIAAGAAHSLALQNGAVYAWGYNGDGELGDGTTIDRTTPVAVSGLGSGVTAIASGHYHSMAVLNGEVYAWGINTNGQLGDGTTIDRDTPTLVSGPSDITDVAASFGSSYALAGDGSLWAWGWNNTGQLGLGDTADRLIPTHLFAPTGYKFASIDSNSSGLHILATVVPVPEPWAVSLVVLGGLALLRRRRAVKKACGG